MYIAFWRGYPILTKYDLKAIISVVLSKGHPIAQSGQQLLGNVIGLVGVMTTYVSTAVLLLLERGTSAQCDIFGTWVSKSYIIP